MQPHIHPLFFSAHYNPQKQLDCKIFVNRKIIIRFINRNALLSFFLTAVSLILTPYQIDLTKKIHPANSDHPSLQEKVETTDLRKVPSQNKFFINRQNGKSVAAQTQHD
jgi:hypothetical protein